MKTKLLTFFTLTCGISFSQITNPAPYCGGQFDDPANSSTQAITRVKLGTLDNVTSNTAYAYPHYVYYNNLPAVDLVRGQSYSITLKQSNEVTLTHGMGAWIDFDGDNVFDTSGDSVLCLQIDTLNSPVNEFTYSFIVPADAALGMTRMRVKIFEDDDYTWIQGYDVTPPCQYPGGILDWGETEDYNVNITENASIQTDEISPFILSRNENLLMIGGETPADVLLISLDGKMIPVTDYAAIDLSALQAGMYILKIQSRQGNWFEEKIIR